MRNQRSFRLEFKRRGRAEAPGLPCESQEGAQDHAGEQLLCRVKRRRVKTTDSKHRFPRYLNLIKGMVISRLNQVWLDFPISLMRSIIRRGFIRPLVTTHRMTSRD